MKRFAVNPNVLLSPVDEGYIAFDVVDEKLYELNPLAALLIELCDGSRTANEIASLVKPHFPKGASDSVHTWIRTAEQNQLLVASSGSVRESAQDMNAELLAELADRLRDDGKTQAAYLCQLRATRLAPEVARYWCHLGELAHITGKRETARDAYQRYLQLHPEDAEVRHLLVSLRDQPPPARVPDECIKHLYQRFSAYYESNMCGELGYEGPQHLLDTVRVSIGDRTDLAVLDLGCGTGLAGELLRPSAARLVGVDLSEEMLAQAKSRRIYDHLVAGELTEWLRSADETFDLIVACDTFIYFGDLRQAIGPAKERLNPGGAVAFSVEQSQEPPFRLTDSGRYEHHFDHLREVADTFQMRITNHREAFLRMEYGVEVFGHYLCLA